MLCDVRGHVSTVLPICSFMTVAPWHNLANRSPRACVSETGYIVPTFRSVGCSLRMRLFALCFTPVTHSLCDQTSWELVRCWCLPWCTAISKCTSVPILDPATMTSMDAAARGRSYTLVCWGNHSPSPDQCSIWPHIHTIHYLWCRIGRLRDELTVEDFESVPIIILMLKANRVRFIGHWASGSDHQVCLAVKHSWLCCTSSNAGVRRDLPWACSGWFWLRGSHVELSVVTSSAETWDLRVQLLSTFVLATATRMM
jgi:hypothetical protein